MTRDIAVVCSADIPVARLSQCILAAGGQYLKGCELFDVYTGAPIPAGYKSVAFSLTLRADEQTLTDDQRRGDDARVLKRLRRRSNAAPSTERSKQRKVIKKLFRTFFENG